MMHTNIMSYHYHGSAEYKTDNDDDDDDDEEHSSGG